MFMEDNTIVNTATLLVIVFSTACFVLETEFKDPSLIEMWFGFESFAVSIFTIEYAVRLMACPRKYSFVLQPLNVVDLIAIVPCACAVTAFERVRIRDGSELARLAALHSTMLTLSTRLRRGHGRHPCLPVGTGIAPECSVPVSPSSIG